MITERDEEQRNDRAAIAWSLFVSVLLNLAIWATITGRWGAVLRDVEHTPPEREFVISSSAILIARKPVPVPRHARSLQRQPPTQRSAQPRHAAVVPQPNAQPTEIARIVPNATPQPRSAPRVERPQTLAQQLAQQEQQFAREAQRLNQTSPLSIATPSNFKPATFHKDYMDLNGKDRRESVTALLMPLPGEHWYANGMSCYYVHYTAQFSGGGTEDGNIPWPVCYPANQDAMLPMDHPHELPVPAPPVGFTLPSSATLGPLLREIYTGAIHN